MTFEEWIASEFPPWRNLMESPFVTDKAVTWNAAVEACAMVSETDDLTCVRSYDLPSEVCEKVAHAIRKLKTGA